MLQQGLPVGREEAETLILDLQGHETAEGRSSEGHGDISNCIICKVLQEI